MTMTVTLPEDLVYDLDLRVNAGEFASRDAAAAYFIRKGLDQGEKPGRPYRPPPLPYQPPGTPSDDRPIQPDPSDVNWADK